MDDPHRLHLVLERLSSLFRARLRESAARHGLKLVQLETLIYLSMANRYSDTPSALADYLGVTKGTAGQTVAALERHGLVDRRVDDEDGRVFHCGPTEQGKRVVKDVYPAAFLEELDAPNLRDASSAAVELLRAIQAVHDFRSFGQCQTCAHFKRDGTRFRCGLTTERLTRADSLRICREHTG